MRMKKLFVETKAGRAPIDARLAEKYELERGARTPFTDARIVDEHGSGARRPAAKSGAGLRGAHDPADRADGTMFTTSEILDFAQGVDSAENGFDEGGRKDG